MRKRISIAISVGDPCGIGPEVVSKALPCMRRVQDAAFFVFGDQRTLERSGFVPQPNVAVFDIRLDPACEFRLGRPTEAGARASILYLQAAVAAIKNGDLDALVTGPISKEFVKKAGFAWPGHTEFLSSAFGARRVEMVFISEKMKVALLTRHVALADVRRSLNKKNIFECGLIVLDLLKKDFKVRDPRIAVCGLNPHAGESGLFGSEESRIIKPALLALNKRSGCHFYGPYAADTVFYRAVRGEFDMVLALYHDQGLIPFKLLEFEGGVNLTAGLPFVRTSPVHGTAFDIAGKGRADPSSMIAAIKLACQLGRNRAR